jgi:hypothetical protein
MDGTNVGKFGIIWIIFEIDAFIHFRWLKPTEMKNSVLFDVAKAILGFEQ